MFVIAVVVAAAVAGACTRRADNTAQTASSSFSSSTVAEQTTTAPVKRDASDVRTGVDPIGELVSGTLITPDGSDRSYHLYVPSSAEDDPLPLVVALHGGLGWGLQFRANSELDRLAEANDFLVVYPDGTRILQRQENRVWNGGACCGVASDARQNVDDVAFISALIDEITDTSAIDPTRIYATGHSNGAILSYRLACELSDKIVAVAFQAGSLELDHCEPSRPVSVLNLHGLDDTNIPIHGGSGDGPSGHTFASPRASIERFAEINRCSMKDTLFDPSNDDLSGQRWTGCDDDATVELILVRGANHAWMGHSGTLTQRLITGSPYPDLDASLTIWQFVSRQSRQ